MHINFNGEIAEKKEPIIKSDNRGFKYGDGLFETLKCINGTILFWEDHYFRLMSSMRILRMEIPMVFTMEFLRSEIVKTLKINNIENVTARIRLTVDRGDGGYYKPMESKVNYLIEVSEISEFLYGFGKSEFVMDIYKDHFVNSGLLSNLKSNNKIINVIGSIYAAENELDSCFLLNNDKMVIEALAGNIFLVKGNIVKTPPLKDGCLKGIMRKQIIALIEKVDRLKLEEASISPFELQKADEIFVTNVIKGIQSVTKYRKKSYVNNTAKYITGVLNEDVKNRIVAEA